MFEFAKSEVSEERNFSFTGKVFISTPRTGVHTDANSTPLEGPWTPSQQPYS